MINTNSKRILIIAGEPSGDMHAAKLVKEVRALDPSIYFYGMGGTLMQQAGVKLIVRAELPIMGVAEIITQLPALWATMRTMRAAIENDSPDLLLLVDYPGFNLRMAKIAKRVGVKVFYYISPKTWASRERRVKVIRKYIDKLAVIFPFEVDYFNKFNIAATFVGNPLTEVVKPTMSIAAAKQQFTLDADKKTIGLFPGSRKSEIRRLVPVMVQTAQRLQQQFSDIQFIMPLAASLTRDDLTPFLADCPVDIKVVEHQTYDVMQVCDAIIAASGTVTLEIALMAVPLVIIYKIFPPYFPFHKILKVDHVGLCNIVGGERIAQELFQQHANPKEISAEISKILLDKQYQQTMRKKLQAVRSQLLADNKANLAQMVINALH